MGNEDNTTISAKYVPFIREKDIAVAIYDDMVTDAHNASQGGFKSVDMSWERRVPEALARYAGSIEEYMFAILATMPEGTGMHGKSVGVLLGCGPHATAPDHHYLVLPTFDSFALAGMLEPNDPEEFARSAVATVRVLEKFSAFADFVEKEMRRGKLPAIASQDTVRALQQQIEGMREVVGELRTFVNPILSLFPEDIVLQYRSQPYTEIRTIGQYMPYCRERYEHQFEECSPGFVSALGHSEVIRPPQSDVPKQATDEGFKAKIKRWNPFSKSTVEPNR